MLFLSIVGHNLERRLGRWAFCGLFVAAGAAAAHVYALLSPSLVPMVGASGAVFGLLGSYFLWFGHNRVVIAVLFVWILRLVRIPARWVLGVYVLVADVLPFVLGQTSNVAHAAHIGGFVAGLGIAYAAESVRGPRRVAAAEENDGPPLTRFLRAMEESRFESAFVTYRSLTPEACQSVAGAPLFTLAAWLLQQLQRPHDALAVLQRFISTHPTSPELPQAHLLAGLVHWRALGQASAAYQHMLTVLDLTADAEQTAVARAVLREIESR
jgi:hypothetical protein